VVGAGRIGRARDDELGDEVAAEVVMAEAWPSAAGEG
jgi:hypothetical protein